MCAEGSELVQGGTCELHIRSEEEDGASRSAESAYGRAERSDERACESNASEKKRVGQNLRLLFQRVIDKSQKLGVESIKSLSAALIFLDL